MCYVGPVGIYQICIFISLPHRHLWARQAFGKLLSKSLQPWWLATRGEQLELSKCGRFYVCLKLHGWVILINTVDLGTAVHEGIFRKAGILKDSNQLRHGYPLPSTPEFTGEYIDDLLVLLQVRRHAARLPTLDTFLAQPAEAA